MQLRVQKNLPTAGLILAGGNSKRFGSDKALAVVDGRPMIEHVHTHLSAVASPVFISIGKKGVTYDLPLRHVLDLYPGRGPLAGIHAGLLASPVEWMLVAPCDMPFLDTESLQKLIAARTTTADAVVATDAAGRPTPVLAIYHRRCLARIEARLALGELSLQGLLDQLEVVQVPLHDEVLRNANDPETIAMG